MTYTKKNHVSQIVNATEVLAHMEHSLFQDNPFFRNIRMQDEQITAGDLIDINKCIISNLLSVIRILQQSEQQAVQRDLLKICQFPGAIDILLNQSSELVTTVRRKSFFFRRKTKLKLKAKSHLIAKISTVEFVSSMVENILLHLKNTRAYEQLGVLETTLLYKTFITSYVLNKNNSRNIKMHPDEYKSLISAHASFDICCCLLSALDRRNASDYRKGIYEELKYYFDRYCGEKLDDVLNRFVAVLEKIDANGIKKVIKDKKDILFVLYLWSLIISMTEALVCEASKIDVNKTKLLKKNLAEARMDYVFDIDDAGNHLLVTDAKIS